MHEVSDAEFRAMVGKFVLAMVTIAYQDNSTIQMMDDALMKEVKELYWMAYDKGWGDGHDEG